MKHILILILYALVFTVSMQGQQLRDGQNRRISSSGSHKDKHAKEKEGPKAKTGLRTWTVDEMTGLTDSVMPDTVPHMFQNSVFSEGAKGFYNSLGNLGSPRQARVFTLRPEMDYFIFAQPYDFFIRKIRGWHFTNTFQPITNVTYHECGDSDNGEDHLRANYAININKDAGIGFNIDYIYGRGYHDNQSTADFGVNLYGSVVKEQYKAHWIVYTDYLKTRENGGITDDAYVTDPQKFPSDYSTKEIPTNLNRVWNKMHYDGIQLTHRYSLGFRRVIKKDSLASKHNSTATDINTKANNANIEANNAGIEANGANNKANNISTAASKTGTAIKNINDAAKNANNAANDVNDAARDANNNAKDIDINVNKEDFAPHKADTTVAVQHIEGSIRVSDVEKAENNAKNANTKQQKNDSTVFVPVTSIIHTVDVGSYRRRFLANQPLGHYYTNNYLDKDSVDENFNNLYISNYVALELSEGLNKYLTAGLRLYAKYDYNHYKMPATNGHDFFNEHRLSLGAQVFRQQSKLLNYLLSAQTSSDGKSWGEFELRGRSKLSVKLLGDSVSLAIRASLLNQKPTFFYRHYQSNYLWWDNDNLNKQLTTAIGATIDSKNLKMRLSADAYTISKYTYFSTSTSQLIDGDDTYTTTNTSVSQLAKNVNILVLRLDKDFVFGPLHWDNSFIYQTTSSKDALPLPIFTGYTNIYLKFKIARVLNTELGADLRYFTKYYAPTYSVALGQFATQAPGSLVEVGNHPVINAYINFHLKHTRFYFMVNHLNYTKDGGTTYGAPHYPINPLVIRFGLSWNFFN